MGLRKEHSALPFNEGFIVESRFWAGHTLYEGSFLGPDKMWKL